MQCGRCHRRATRSACWCSCGRVLTAARRSVRCFCWCGCKLVGARRRAARGDRCPGAFDQCKLLRKSCRERVGGAGLLYNGSRCEDSATRARPEWRRSAGRPARRNGDGGGSWGEETSPRRELPKPATAAPRVTSAPTTAVIYGGPVSRSRRRYEEYYVRRSYSGPERIGLGSLIRARRRP